MRTGPAPRRLGVTRAVRTNLVELAYAGITFELVVHGELAFQLPDDYAPYVGAPGQYATAARVTCAVCVDVSTAGGPRARNRAEYDARQGGFVLRGDYASAEVDELSPGYFVASARIAPEPMGWAALLRFLAAGVIERVGGVSFHAAALAIEGRAVLLTGPSGAGKSTACDLSPGARCLAYDQVVVYPTATGYHAWALPWGKGSTLPRAPEAALPLAGVLRVTRGTPTPRAWSATAMEALFELRQAVSTNERTVEAEDARLHTLLRLADEVSVGFLSTVLGQLAGPTVAGWLKQAQEVAA